MKGQCDFQVRCIWADRCQCRFSNQGFEYFNSPKITLYIVVIIVSQSRKVLENPQWRFVTIISVSYIGSQSSGKINQSRERNFCPFSSSWSQEYNIRGVFSSSPFISMKYLLSIYQPLKNTDIDMAILENIDIDIAILENIDIHRHS